MNELAWTEEPPTEPGWYWNHYQTRVDASGHYYMYLIVKSERDGSLWVDGEYDNPSISSPAHKNTMWYGPVDPPEAP